MKTAILVALSTLAVLGGLFLLTSDQKDSLKQDFLAFKQKHNKSYGSKTELEFRFNVYSVNMKMIKAGNTDESKTYTLGENVFADLTFSEFKNQYLMPPKTNKTHESLLSATVSSKRSVDWRTVPGAVGPVKDQGQCGSCWAFSTVAGMETAFFLRNNRFVSFSEQELVDCAGGNYHNQGCNGGIMPYAYMYIMDNQISTEGSYPYRGVQGSCQASYKSPRYPLDDFAQISPINVDGLIKATDITVVSVAFEVQEDLQFYKGGIYNPSPSCGQALNHAVNTVGYNTDTDTPYFIVRNSWGSWWGEQGYFRMTIGTGSGSCGIANETCTYPLLS